MRNRNRSFAYVNGNRFAGEGGALSKHHEMRIYLSIPLNDGIRFPRKFHFGTTNALFLQLELREQNRTL